MTDTTVTLDHVFTRRLRDAGLGQFPAADRGIEVGPALSGPCDAILLFSEHLVVAADVTAEWAAEESSYQRDHADPDPSTGLGLFLEAISQRMGNPPMIIGVLLVAPYQPAFVHGKAEPGGEVDPDWAVYRSDVRSYRYRSAGVSGVIGLGRGPGDRWDVYVRVDEHVGSGGQASRELFTVARTLAPDRDLLFASAPLHDPRVLRAVLGSGFLPICTEALLLTRPAG